MAPITVIAIRSNNTSHHTGSVQTTTILLRKPSLENRDPFLLPAYMPLPAFPANQIAALDGMLAQLDSEKVVASIQACHEESRSVYDAVTCTKEMEFASPRSLAVFLNALPKEFSVACAVSAAWCLDTWNSQATRVLLRAGLLPSMVQAFDVMWQYLGQPKNGILHLIEADQQVPRRQPANPAPLRPSQTKRRDRGVFRYPADGGALEYPRINVASAVVEKPEAREDSIVDGWNRV